MGISTAYATSTLKLRFEENKFKSYLTGPALLNSLRLGNPKPVPCREGRMGREFLRQIDWWTLIEKEEERNQEPGGSSFGSYSFS